MGVMHGFALKDAPGSAATVLQDLADELRRLHLNTNATSQAFSTHDDSVARAMDVADQGGTVSGSSHSYQSVGASGMSPLHKTLVGVIPGASIKKLMLDLQATDGPAAFNSQRVWVDVIQATSEIATGLADVSAHVSANNSGAAVDAMLGRLNSAGQRASTISGNASIMNTLLGQLDATRMRKLGEVTAAMLEIESMNAFGPFGAAAARTAEQMFLGYYAATTQAELMGLIPPVVNLTSPDRGTVGGSSESAMSEVDGTGSRYSTAGIVTPEALADQVYEAARTYPETFDRINSVTRDMATGAGTDIGEGLFSPQGIRTEAATVASPSGFSGLGTPGPSAGVGAAGTTGTPPGWTGVAPASTASLPGAGIAGLPSSSGVTGPQPGSRMTGIGPAASTGTPGSVTPAGARLDGVHPTFPGAAQSASPTAGGSGGRVLPNHGFAPGSAGPVTGPLNPGPVGGAATSGQSTGTGRGPAGTTGLHSSSGQVSGAPAMRPGFNGAGSPGAAPLSSSNAQDSDTAKRASSSGGGLGTNNAHANSAARGGVAPMMGSGAAGNRGGSGGSARGPQRGSQVRTVTSSVERDGDQRELLGDRSPVVPGVIGDWVRDEPSRY